MKQLDFDFYFSMGDGYTAEDEACEIDIPDYLYNALKKEYKESGETDLQTIFDDGNLSEKALKALEKLIETLSNDLIELQHDNGDDCDPDTGEEYDFSSMNIDISIRVPDEWDEE